ncbi:peroxiredoxin [Paraferrimonas sp. SM1919]|uniref:peroxiredoxin n=1 Tax=Paraferrimonas sp. SM1919 TaxID=2662263 RepID=UPI0013D526BA|nr:peroxiredoxin [Paraferrimonas sp. SM1919]
MIEQGQYLPNIPVSELSSEGMQKHDLSELLKAKVAILFAVPGAFTPTCSNAHLPGFIDAYKQLQAKGVDYVGCLSVNDAFVMKAWGETQGQHQIHMLADGDGSFCSALGLTVDTKDFGGIRSKRFALIVKDAKVVHIAVDQPMQFEVSSAEAILKQL